MGTTLVGVMREPLAAASLEARALPVDGFLDHFLPAADLAGGLGHEINRR
jgi:hypothetical protein